MDGQTVSFGCTVLTTNNSKRYLGDLPLEKWKNFEVRFNKVFASPLEHRLTTRNASGIRSLVFLYLYYMCKAPQFLLDVAILKSITWELEEAIDNKVTEFKKTVTKKLSKEEEENNMMYLRNVVAPKIDTDLRVFLVGISSALDYSA